MLNIPSLAVNRKERTN